MVEFGIKMAEFGIEMAEFGINYVFFWTTGSKNQNLD